MDYENLKTRIESLSNAEKMSKELFSPLSRDLLQFLLDTGDVRPINLLMSDGILSAINLRTARNFFKNFVPFENINGKDDKLESFGKIKPSKKEEKFQKIRDFLADPLNNIYTWANRHEEVVVKEWKIDHVTNTVKKALEKGFSKETILRATLEAGITAKDILALMGELAKEEEAREEAKAKAKAEKDAKALADQPPV